MGYSIYVKVESEEVAEKFYDFLYKNMKHINKEMFDLDDNCYGLDTDLSYADEDCFTIGFEYGGGGADRAYAHCITKWIARKVGEGKYFWDSDEMKLGEDITLAKSLKESVKSIFHNPNRKETITMKEAKERAVTQLLGFYVFGKDRADETIVWIDNEIKRLDELWDKKEKNV